MINRYRKAPCLKLCKGQAMIETMIITVIITAFIFATLQICIAVVDDMVANEAAFSSMRVACVAPARAVQERADTAAKLLLMPGMLKEKNNLLIGATAAKVWTNTIDGREDMVDHSGVPIRKFNTNIPYSIGILFPSLLRPFHDLTFFSGGIPFLERTARSRMVRSPDETFYYRSYPGGRPFTRNENEQQ